MAKQLLFACLLYGTALLLPYVAFVLGAFLVGIFSRTYVPLFVGFIIEIQFGFIDGFVLWYVLGAGAAMILSELVRPLINVRQLG